MANIKKLLFTYFKLITLIYFTILYIPFQKPINTKLQWTVNYPGRGKRGPMPNWGRGGEAAGRAVVG